ncbi:hypothetical protein H5410_051795, partial [Solanum commersonii]
MSSGFQMSSNQFLKPWTAMTCFISRSRWKPRKMMNAFCDELKNKTNFYDLFPSKAEEEASKVNNTPRVVTRELVEIRDLYLAQKIDLENPWQITKKKTSDEIVVGMLMIPFIQMFEYILRYWTLDMAKSLENGCK